MGKGIGSALGTWASVGLNGGLNADKPDVTGYGGDLKGYDLKQYGESPYSSPLKSMISGFQAPSEISPSTVTADGSSYAAKDMSKTSLPQYDAMRSRLASQYSQQQAQGQDAIDRQFAAAGGGPGNGAQAKQTENLVAATASAKSADTQNLDAQEANTRQQLQQVEDQRAFESGEATKGRTLQAGEFNAGAENSARQFNAGLSLQEQNQLFGETSTISQLDLGYQQAQAEAKNNEFNKIMSQFQAEHSGGLFGGGGMLGLGI